jgi:hypothetical protein
MKYLDALPGGDDKIVHLWDIDKGEAITRFEGHAKWSISVVIAPDGQHILSASVDGTSTAPGGHGDYRNERRRNSLPIQLCRGLSNDENKTPDLAFRENGLGAPCPRRTLAPIGKGDGHGLLRAHKDLRPLRHSLLCDGIWLGRSLDGTKPDLSKIIADRYIIWTERPTEVNVVRIKAHSVTVHPVALASTGVLTSPVFWLGFWRPVRRYRGLRAAALIAGSAK